MKKQILIGLLVALSMQSVVVARNSYSSCNTRKEGPRMDPQLIDSNKRLTTLGAGSLAAFLTLELKEADAVPYVAVIAAMFGYVAYEANKKLNEISKKAESDYKEQCIREPETGVCVKVPCSCKSEKSVINEKNLIQPDCPSRYNEDGRPLVFGQK